MTQNPKTLMMNSKTFLGLCQETYLPSLVKVIAEGNVVEARRKIVAQRNHILMLNVHFLSKSPKVALNSSKNASKLLIK
jgi:hypothetical protein